MGQVKFKHARNLTLVYSSPERRVHVEKDAHRLDDNKAMCCHRPVRDRDFCASKVAEKCNFIVRKNTQVEAGSSRVYFPFTIGLNSLFSSSVNANPLLCVLRLILFSYRSTFPCALTHRVPS